MDMRHGFLTCMAVLAGAGLCAGAAAAELEQITGNRNEDGVVVSFMTKTPEAANQAVIYIDTDSKTDSGFSIGNIGADYKYENGKFYLYVGDGTSQNWDAVDADILNATRKKRVIIFFPNKTLEIAGVSPVRAVVAQGEQTLQTLDIRWQRAGKEEPPCRRNGKMVEYIDPAGDVSPQCRIDFIKMFVKPHPEKADTLMFGFTCDFPIERRNLKYHLRLMFRIGEGPGADVNGETFNYMFESPNRVFRFAGKSPRQWKWEKLGAVPVRFTKQWCEIDIPLAIFKLETMPERVKFRLSCERNDFVPDLRYAMPEYIVK